MCIAAFVLLGAIPSLLVGWWCLDRHMPGCARAEADSLGRQLGFVVKLEAVKYLRPGVVLYQGMELADPETGQTVFRSRCIEVAWQQRTDEQGRRRPTLCVIASQPEVETARIDLAWRWMQRLLESQPGRGETNLEFSAGEVTLRAGDRSQTLTEVAGLMENLPGKTRAQLDFLPVGANTNETPASVCIERNRETSPPVNSFELSTDGNKLPCSLLAMVFGELKPLGGRCRFHGRIWANEGPDGWDAKVAGHLVDLNLDSLVTERFQHRLSGIGEATIESARFRRGRLEECNGQLVARGGVVSGSLLEAAVRCLRLVPGVGPFPSDDRIRYQELAMSFTLDASGLRLRGHCANSEPGTILSDGRNRLLGEPSPEPQPVAALVQTLVPRSVLQVPASRQTDWLLHHLPVPHVLSSPGVETVPPTARLRLPETWQR